jgi:hypothetical protein
MHKKLSVLLVAVMMIGLILTACGGSDEPAAAPTVMGNAPAAGEEAAPAPEETAPTGDEALPVEEAAPTGDEATPAPEPAPSSGDVTPTQTEAAPSGGGNLVADIGFRPEVNGLPFANYGNDVSATNLTPAEMQRIFGNGVCGDIKDGQCLLSPPAQQWMEQWNGTMGGGHCYGFSVTSLRFFLGQLQPSDFGASAVADLNIQGNEKLQREIAYDFTPQGFDSVRAGAVGGTPNDVLDKLVEILNARQEAYTIGFFKANGDGGHAVTPYAVEDRGNGVFAVLIYDNNWPKTPREMIFDRNANTWTYNAAINPNEAESQYAGDASTQSLFLFPTSPGIQTQSCPFCAPGASARAGGLAAPEPEFNEIWLDGAANLLIVDEQGNKLGHDGDKLVNEIPGARYEAMMSGDLYSDDQEPVYYVPIDTNFNMTIDGSQLKEATATDVVVIGPGYDIGLEGVMLDPGQQDDLTILPKDGILSYRTESSESPNIILGTDREDADFAFEIQGADMEGGGRINVALNVKDGDLLINAEELKNDGAFALTMTRIDDQGEETFYNDEISLKAGGVVYVYYAEWKGNGTPVGMAIDSNGDGEIDEMYTSTDEN